MSKAITQRIANKLDQFPNEFTKRDIAKTLKASFLDVSNACIKLEKEGVLVMCLLVSVVGSLLSIACQRGKGGLNNEL